MTKKNHYNPCFWTAYWNFEYLKSKREKSLLEKEPRKQEVYILNLKSENILKNKTENIFIQKKAGIAKINPQDALEFTKRNFLEDYDQVARYQEKNPSDLIIDFESNFTLMEECYTKSLNKLILSDEPITIPDKADLSLFLVFQLMRNPKHLDRMIEKFKENGWKKFELLISIKNQIGNPNKLREFAIPFAFPTWTIYKLSKNRFPLPDNAVMIKNHNLMVAISPNIMLEMNMKEQCKEVQPCFIKTKISYFKYRKFIRRTIENSFKEIIFGNEEFLEKLGKSRFYKKHLKRISNA